LLKKDIILYPNGDFSASFQTPFKLAHAYPNYGYKAAFLRKNGY